MTIDLLRPGLAPYTLGGELGVLGLRSTADLASAYAWHDGTDATCGGTTFPRPSPRLL